MDTGTTPTASLPHLPRAGFWRRIFAQLIDGIIIVVPFQVVAAILFALTAGYVQMNSGLMVRTCHQVTTLPQGLTPPPPRDANFAQVCQTSLFGAKTGIVLTVSRITKEGITTTAVHTNYLVDKDGHIINGWSIDMLSFLALFIYLVVMIRASGQSWGDRIAKTRVIDITQPDATGVPLRKAVIRYLAMMIGTVPMLAGLLYQYATSDGTADAIFTDNFFVWFKLSGGLAFFWIVVLVIQIAIKVDPVYDWLAGTAVVRTGRVEAADPAQDPQAA